MLKPTFHRLPPDRQRELMRVCLAEFADHGYEAASTNRIVREMGVSKGLLFKYAGSKEALYLHLVEEVFEELGRVQGSPEIYHSPDLFQRLTELIDAALAYAAEHPLRFRFSLRASIETSDAVAAETEAIRVRIGAANLGPLFDGIDWDLYRMPRAEVEQVFAWLVKGTRVEAIAELQRAFSIQRYEELIRSQLALVDRLLHGGVYRPAEDRS